MLFESALFTYFCCCCCCSCSSCCFIGLTIWLTCSPWKTRCRGENAALVFIAERTRNAAFCMMHLSVRRTWSASTAKLYNWTIYSARKAQAPQRTQESRVQPHQINKRAPRRREVVKYSDQCANTPPLPRKYSYIGQQSWEFLSRWRIFIYLKIYYYILPPSRIAVNISYTHQQIYWCTQKKHHLCYIIKIEIVRNICATREADWLPVHSRSHCQGQYESLILKAHWTMPCASYRRCALHMHRRRKQITNNCTEL